MSTTTTRVSVQSDIHKLTDGRRKPYRVRWTVDGRRKDVLFERKGQAEDFRDKLKAAVVAGTPFDVETRLPVEEAPSAAPAALTCLELARQVIAAEVNAPGVPMPAKTLEHMVVGMATVTQSLVDPTAAGKPPRVELQGALERHLNPRRKARPTCLTEEQLALRAHVDIAAVAWVERHSLPVAEVTTEHVRAALALCGTKLDGTPRASSSLYRERKELVRLLDEAVDRRLLPASPMPRSKRHRGGRSRFRTRQVRRDEVPTMPQARAFVKCVGHAATKLQLELIRLQGLRPGEAAALQVRDIRLRGPEPVLEVRGSRTEARPEFTRDGANFEAKAVKTDHGQDDEDAVARVVPLFSETVELLRPLVEGRDPDELLVATRNGTPVQSRNRSRSMKRARQAWLESLSEQERAEVPEVLLTGAYHLRHAHATALLLAGMPVREVAAR